jgi:hypothetical protein
VSHRCAHGEFSLSRARPYARQDAEDVLPRLRGLSYTR